MNPNIFPYLTAAAIVSGTAAAQERPNILFILTDDMQTGSIAALGNPDTVTPNIDSLANSGTRFTRAYTNGALCGALSMPSRAMIMTGRHMFEIQSDGMTIPACHTTMPEHFMANGYRTFATGKWHSDKASFARSFSDGDNIFFGGMHPYENGGHVAPCLYHYDSDGEYTSGQFVGKEFSSKMFADAAISFIRDTSRSQDPFFAYVAFTSPHDPRNIIPEYGKKYSGENLAIPYNFLPEHPFDNGEMNIRDEMIVPSPRTSDQIRGEMALYYGMVSEVDIQIGRVLEALRQSGKQDKTIIVFASDNGLALGQNGLLGKQSLYDHSVGVPLFIIDPRYPEYKENDSLCYLSDLFPTLCEMTGTEIPESVTANSLAQSSGNSHAKHREDLMLAYSNIQRAIVKGNYKYIIYNVGGKITEQLFDLSEDPGEINDLSTKKPSETAAMRNLLRRRMKENNDFCDLGNPLWWKDGHKLTWDELILLYIFDQQ